MERARSRMRALKMSQQALAQILGMTRGAVGHYLSGRRKPDLDQLNRIANALQVQPAWLLYGWGIIGVQEEGAEYLSGQAVTVAITGDTQTGPGDYTGESVRLPVVRENCYGLAVVGDGYAPRWLDGEVLLVSPSRAAAPGDEVVVRFDDGTSTLMHLISLGSGETVFKPLLETDSHTIARNDTIVFMHPVIGVVRPALRAVEV